MLEKHIGLPSNPEKKFIKAFKVTSISLKSLKWKGKNTSTDSQKGKHFHRPSTIEGFQ